MDIEFGKLLQAYLDRRIELNQVTDWVARHIWYAEGELRDFIHEVAIELAHLDDGYVDEDYFRRQVAEILEARKLHVGTAFVE